VQKESKAKLVNLLPVSDQSSRTKKKFCRPEKGKGENACDIKLFSCCHASARVRKEKGRGHLGAETYQKDYRKKREKHIPRKKKMEGETSSSLNSLQGPSVQRRGKMSCPNGKGEGEEDTKRR